MIIMKYLPWKMLPFDLVFPAFLFRIESFCHNSFNSKFNFIISSNCWFNCFICVWLNRLQINNEFITELNKRKTITLVVGEKEASLFTGLTIFFVLRDELSKLEFSLLLSKIKYIKFHALVGIQLKIKNTNQIHLLLKDPFL